MTTRRVPMPTDPDRAARVRDAIADETAYRERPTHLLAVVGKAIARETNIQDSPVRFGDNPDRTRTDDVEAIMLATVRRCTRHRPDLHLEVEWNGPAKAAVIATARGRSETIARFTLRPITDADRNRIGARTTIPKELLP